MLPPYSPAMGAGHSRGGAALRRSTSSSVAWSATSVSGKAPAPGAGETWPSQLAQAGRQRVRTGIQQQQPARVQRMGSTCLGRTSELDPSSTMTSRRMLTNANKPPARPRRHEARRAAASTLVHSGRNLPTSHRGNAISCTHRRRHEHISSKKRDKAGDDGGNSGGIGCDEVSSMGGGGKVLGEATRSSCTPHRQICRRRARRRGRQRRG